MINDLGEFAQRLHVVVMLFDRREQRGAKNAPLWTGIVSAHPWRVRRERSPSPIIHFLFCLHYLSGIHLSPRLFTK